MKTPRFSFEEWVRWVFDHPVADVGSKEWWWTIPGRHLSGRWLDVPSWRSIRYMTRLFENPLAALGSYSDEQIDQGLWFIFHEANSRHMEGLSGDEVSMSLRRRCLRAIVPLYRKLIVPRSSEQLQHGADAAGDPLNSIGYMLWDFVVKATRARPELVAGTAKIGVRTVNEKVDDEILGALIRLLTIPHLACQEAALHGLSHMHQTLPDRTVSPIDNFIAGNPRIEPRLRQYAEYAREGKCL